jgi:hypothetical protein
MQVTTSFYKEYNLTLNEYYDKYEVDVEVPNEKIYKILARKFGISTDQMEKIINYFDLDLTLECEENEDIQLLAQEIYCEERD